MRTFGFPKELTLRKERESTNFNKTQKKKKKKKRERREILRKKLLEPNVQHTSSRLEDKRQNNLQG